MSTISHTLSLFTCVPAIMEKAPFNNLLTCEQALGLLEEHSKCGAKRMSPPSPYSRELEACSQTNNVPASCVCFLACALCFLLSRRYHCRFVEVLNNCLNNTDML